MTKPWIAWLEKKRDSVTNDEEHKEYLESYRRVEEFRNYIAYFFNNIFKFQFAQDKEKEVEYQYWFLFFYDEVVIYLYTKEEQVCPYYYKVCYEVTIRDNRSYNVRKTKLVSCLPDVGIQTTSQRMGRNIADDILNKLCLDDSFDGTIKSVCRAVNKD